MALRKGEGATGRLAETREPVEIPDIAVPHAYQSRLRDMLLRLGFRALLAVPLLREDQIIGGPIINRKSPAGFPPGTPESLGTFSTAPPLHLPRARAFPQT